MDKVLELLGVKTLSESKQNEVKSLLTNLITNRLDVDPINYDQNMNKLMESIGGNKLKTEDQRNLIEKLNLIIDIQSQKINHQKQINENGKINKDWFKWDSTAEVKKSVDKISKDWFQWESSGYGGRPYTLREQSGTESMIVFFDRYSHKILMSGNEDFPTGYKLTSDDMSNLVDMGFTLVPVDTSNDDWRQEMMNRYNKILGVK